MERLSVFKTYKIYVNGQFVRSESGRYFELRNKQKEIIANVCLSSKKDFKNSVVAARSAFQPWANRSAFNRSQILYRLAEMLEGKRSQLISELQQQGYTPSLAKSEVNTSIDRIVYYAGWCDKYTQLFSTVNSVNGPHFNFSVPEPCGVVSIITADDTALLSLISAILPVIAGGNTCVALASEKFPISAVTFAEALTTSDFPPGVVNVLTGKKEELHKEFASHMDVNALVFSGTNKIQLKNCMSLCSTNLKRFHLWNKNWKNKEEQNPYLILDLQEIKTSWHPIETTISGGSSY